MSVMQLVRPDLRDLDGYSSARQESTTDGILLNANESPWPAQPGSDLHRYPQPQPAELRAGLAALYSVEPDQVLLCRGSGEGIDLLVRAFCRAGRDAIVVCPPTFGLYAICAGIQGAETIEAPPGAGFVPDIDTILAAMTPAAKLVFLASPNNPTGGLTPANLVDDLAGRLAGQAMLVLDEAYIEFAQAESTASLLSRHENLVVLRTLSKAWALAGARIGAVLAHPDVVSLLARILAPYPLPTPSIAAALSALNREARAEYKIRVARIVAERERLRHAFAGMPGIRGVLASEANFLCVRFEDTESVLSMLGERGIVVRDVRSQPGLGDCLRISVGAPEDNDRLLQALASAREIA